MIRWIALISGAALAAVVVTGLLAGLLETIWLSLGHGGGQDDPPEE